jgi:excisionase family DNA binding protein
MNKKEAAVFLQVSEKTIERYKSAGKLSAKMKRITGDDGKARQVLDFSETELQRFKQELSGEIIFPIITDRHAQTKTQTDTDRQTQLDRLNIANEESLIVGQTQTVTAIQAIFNQIETVFNKQMQASDRAQKLTLSIPEASIISGLPKSFIRQSIKDGNLKAVVIGRTYKIKRTDLYSFVQDL